MAEVVTEDPPAMTTAEVAAELLPDQVINLLREYEVKLRRRATTALELKQTILTSRKGQDVEAQKDLFNTIVDWFWKLRSPASDLIRHASTMIEGVKLKRLTRLELRLRLAELEAALQRAEKAILK